MSDSKLILIGYSGHGLVIADVAKNNKLDVLGYAEKLIKNKNPYNLDYLGDEKDENFIGWKNKTDFIIGIGDNLIREKVFKLILSNGCKVRTIICKSANISESVTIGQGTFINKNVSINAFAKVGQNVILNTSCVVEHECIISDSVHIAPGAVLAGKVTVGERSFIGANSVIKQGIQIGKDVIVGAGSVIVKDIPDGCKVAGNPSRKL